MRRLSASAHFFALFLPFPLLGFFLPNFRENLFDGNTTLGSFRLRSFAFGLLALPNPIGDTPISELLSLDTKARVVSLRLGYRRAMKNSKHKQRKAKSSPDQICCPLAQNSPLALEIPQQLADLSQFSCCIQSSLFRLSTLKEGTRARLTLLGGNRL
jgi:hypothetical protein